MIPPCIEHDQSSSFDAGLQKETGCGDSERCITFQAEDERVVEKRPLPSNTLSVFRAPPALPNSLASQCPIRSRFLNRLGISKLERTQTSACNTVEGRKQSRRDSFEEILKKDYGQPDENVDALLSMSASLRDCARRHKIGQNRGVRFRKAVTIHPIPCRTDYSERMRCALWTPTEVLQENVARNSLEFAAENWDWRQVVDDKDMVLCAGKRIHPVHFVAEQCNLRRHFFTVMSAQQKSR